MTKADCQTHGCVTTAAFGLTNSKRIYCAKHKQPAMINLSVRRCSRCSNPAYYGYTGKIPTSCSVHWSKGMLKHPTKKCITCKNPATYGNSSANYHCNSHKNTQSLSEVERIGRYIDLFRENTDARKYPPGTSWYTSS